jgi:LAS superfamily LD-carboxypeptidase LdcB
VISPEQILGLNEQHVRLVSADSQHKLHGDVIPAFLQMQEAAALAGHDLQLVSSYRSFARQAAIWNRKWNGELKLNNLRGETLNTAALTDIEKMHAILLWSALPGGSRHHWGTDFDIYDRTQVENRSAPFELVSEEYESDGPCAALSLWVQAHARSFDFELPYAHYVGGVAAEPWHLSYKPLAQEVTNEFSVDLLRQHLVESGILGLDTVLLNINELFERYTLNKGLK